MKPFKILKDYHYFESQEENEQVIVITRRHWLNLVMPFVASFFIGLLLVIFFRISVGRGELIFGDLEPAGKSAFEILILMYIVFVAFGTWLMRYLNVIILTNKHIVDVSQKSFFARSVSTLELGNIEDVSIDKNGFLATVLDYGDIKIQTAGELPNFELKKIADPEMVQRTIMETKGSLK
jgi:hypothetical protein